MNGSKVLSASGFTQSGNTWSIGGQTQQLPNPFSDTSIMEPGYECEIKPEMLYVNGHKKMHRVCALTDLGPGKWYFDTAADRIYLYDNPSSFTLIETSVAGMAFAGLRVKNVYIENLTVEKYGSSANSGAIGGGWTDRGWERNPYNWTIRYVTSRWNHGSGITTGPGFIIENTKLYENGHFGIGGDGHEGFDCYAKTYDFTLHYASLVTFRNSEVTRNGTVGYKRGWGSGGSKFSCQLKGTIVENNWFHENYGPGIWFDINNIDSIIRSNLVENNGITYEGPLGGIGRAIFYEVSDGPAKIYWNTIRNNPDAAVFISTSGPTEVYENAISGGSISWQRYPTREWWWDGTGPGTSIYFHHNDVASPGTIAWLFSQVDGLPDILARAKADYNTYRASSTAKIWRYNGWCCAYNFAEWQSVGFDRNGKVLTGTPVLPSTAVPFKISLYGQQAQTPPEGTSPSPVPAPAPTPTPTDTTAPTVAISSPSDGAMISTLMEIIGH